MRLYSHVLSHGFMIHLITEIFGLLPLSLLPGIVLIKRAIATFSKLCLVKA